jgi:uncharacterized membrane protein
VFFFTTQVAELPRDSKAVAATPRLTALPSPPYVPFSRTAAVWLSNRPVKQRVWVANAASRALSALFRLTPTPPPTASVAPTTANEPKDQQQYNRAYKGVDDQGNNPCAEVDTKLRQQPVANECTDQTDSTLSADVLL